MRPKKNKETTVRRTLSPNGLKKELSEKKPLHINIFLTYTFDNRKEIVKIPLKKFIFSRCTASVTLPFSEKPFPRSTRRNEFSHTNDLNVYEVAL